MTPGRTTARIAGFTLRVRHPDRSARFYREALGFEGAPARLTLGAAALRLQAAPPGEPLHPPAAANAPDFQHFAIRVRDMAAAYARVAAFDPGRISRGGPQRLPPANGSVTAWKFRDPDGHPLELLQPADPSPGTGPLFEAIDHTALSCADVGASLAFYAALGLSRGPSSHNRGAAQDRLDGLDGVDLHIATVHTPEQGPHIELLHYLRPASPPPAQAPSSPFIVTLLEGEGAAPLRDPDGHVLEGEVPER